MPKTRGYFLRRGQATPIKSGNPYKDIFFGTGGDAAIRFDASEIGLARAYMSSLWAYRCITIRGQNVAKIPLQVKTHDGQFVDVDGRAVETRPSKIASQHILQQFLGSGNTRLIRQTEYDMCIWGHSFWEPSQEGIQRLSPWTIEIDKDEYGIQGYRQKLNGVTTAEWEADELVYFYDFDPLDDTGTVSPLAMALRAIDVEISLADYVKAFLDNDAVPAGLLLSDEEIDENEKSRLELWWNKLFQGPQQRGRVGILGGGIRFEQLGASLGDLALSDLRREVRKEVCAAFGVPTTLALADDSANFATAREEHLGLYENTIIPALDLIVDTINGQLVPMFDRDLKVVMELSHITVLQAAKETLSSRLVSGFQAGVYSLNEVRELEGLPILEKDLFLMNGELVPREQLGAPPSEDTEDEGGGFRSVTDDFLESDDRFTQAMSTEHGFYPRKQDREEERVSARPNLPAIGRGTDGRTARRHDAAARLGKSFFTRDGRVSSIKSVKVSTTPALDDLRRWKQKVLKRGPKVGFFSDHIPGAIKTFLEWDLDNIRSEDPREQIRLAFETARAHIKSADPTPEEFEEYWDGIDGLAEIIEESVADIINDPTVKEQMAAQIAETNDPESAVVFLQGLIDAWVDRLVGDEDTPGPIAQVFLAGAARGQQLHDKTRVAAGYRKAAQMTTAWDLLNQAALARAREYTYDMVRGINNTTVEAFRHDMGRWIDMGGSLSGLTDMLRGRLTGLDIPRTRDESGNVTEIWSPRKIEWATSRNRARQIAQTESTRVFTEGNQARWNQLGVQDVKWRTQNDRVVCPLCKRMNNEVGNVNTGWEVPSDFKSSPDFIKKFQRLLQPDGRLKIPAHPGCRCFPLPLVPSRTHPMEKVSAPVKPRSKGKESDLDRVIIGDRD